MKNSDYLAPALDALQTGRYTEAVRGLRLVLMETPAATAGGEEYDPVFSTKLRNMRLHTQWLIMIAQRLNGQFTDAEETLQPISHLVDELTISLLYTDNLGNILLSQALDGETYDMIQQMLDQAQ
jgi:hypothetical protein